MKTTLVLFTLVFFASAFSFAADGSSLKPPAGSRIALVVFEDLQCPDCARAAPLLEEAARVYKIPLVHHDFPLQKHNWSKQAAVIARYLDTKSKKLGDEFRDYCFKHQSAEAPLITSPSDLQARAEAFARGHGTALPFAIDPRGELQQGVEQDVALGNRIGLDHTPTIFIVTDTTVSKPWVEVVDRTHLYEQIDEMKKQAEANAPKTTTVAAKKTKKTARKQ